MDRLQKACGVKATGSLTSEAAVMPPLALNVRGGLVAGTGQPGACGEGSSGSSGRWAKALRDPNAHVEAVGQDEAHTATPTGQDIG